MADNKFPEFRINCSMTQECQHVVNQAEGGEGAEEASAGGADLEFMSTSHRLETGFRMQMAMASFSSDQMERHHPIILALLRLPYLREGFKTCRDLEEKADANRLQQPVFQKTIMKAKSATEAKTVITITTMA